MSWLGKLLGIKPDDWILMWHTQTPVRVTHYNDWGNHVTNEVANYHIMFSPSRKKYKLKMSGWNPMKWDDYTDACKMLSQFNKTLL